MKGGMYLGGIRDIEDLRQRCRVCDETGCWHWGLAIVQGVPSVHFVLNGKRMKQRGRRAAILLSGRSIPKGHVVFAKDICKSDDCVNPDHSRSGNRNASGAALAASGKVKGLPTKIKASRESWKKRKKITEEMAVEIRASDESAYKLSKRLGISTYAIWACKVGRSHKPQGASVFNWRP